MDAQPNFGPHPEDVIDAGLMSDSDSEGQNIQQPPALSHVEVFIPLEQINPDEIQLEELMDHDFEEDDNFQHNEHCQTRDSGTAYRHRMF